MWSRAKKNKLDLSLTHSPLWGNRMWNKKEEKKTCDPNRRSKRSVVVSLFLTDDDDDDGTTTEAQKEKKKKEVRPGESLQISFSAVHNQLPTTSGVN